MGELCVEATIMSDEEASVLRVSQPASAFRLEHLFYDFEYRPISWGWLRLPTRQATLPNTGWSIRSEPRRCRLGRS